MVNRGSTHEGLGAETHRAYFLHRLGDTRKIKVLSGTCYLASPLLLLNARRLLDHSKSRQLFCRHKTHKILTATKLKLKSKFDIIDDQLRAEAMVKAAEAEQEGCLRFGIEIRRLIGV